MWTLTELFLENAIKSAVLAGVVALITFLPKVRHLADLQHALWGMVLAAMIVPSLIELPILYPSQSTNSVGALPDAPSISNDVTSAIHAKLGEPHEVVASPLSGNRSEGSGLFWLVTAACLGGTVCLLLIAVRKVQLLRRTIRYADFNDARLSSIAEDAARRLGIRRRVKVAMVQTATSPFIWVEPRAIYVVISESLRDSLSDSPLLCIMLHELSHYRRRDHWSNTFGFLVLALCWWNPLSWFAVRRMRSLQEYCCDAMAIAKSQSSRREYAECLYKITSFIESRNTCLPASACELFGHTSVEERFKMIANARVGFQSTKTGLFMILLFAALLPCTLAFSQGNKKEAQSDQEKQAKNDAESKEWHETMEKFNRFVQDGDWKKAEQLANETASKFGHDDALVQNMLLTSINGVRKAQGLAPILVEKLVADPKSNENSIVVLYSIKDSLPANSADKDRFVEILTHCISASIANDASDKSSPKVYYDGENHGLIVFAPRPKHKLVEEILKRMSQKTKP